MRLVLSRFACLRREGTSLVVDAGSGSVVELEDAAALAIVAALTQPRSVAEAAEAAGVPEDTTREYAEALIACGALVEDDRASREEQSLWTAPERLVHLRSRRPGVPQGSSGPPPALPPSEWSPTIALPVPDLDRLEARDSPFAVVQQARRSHRAHSSEPLSVTQLGEFLYRVGRVVDVENVQDWLDLAIRPYPSAGGLYELELYPLVGACAGLDPGLYHYAADLHRLALVSEPCEATDGLRRAAAAGMGGVALPQVLLVVAGRFDRLAWKYGPLSYSLMLKDTGVLMQTMYLAATAMGLAGCAVGAGDATLFAEASGLEVDDQASVGEFCLGVPVSAGEALDGGQ